MTNYRFFVPKVLCTLLIAALYILLLPLYAQAAIVAFPGAEGFGRFATGGRGGSICTVTNTNNSGSGSFRACAEQSGKRIIVFKTGGLIRLQSRIIFRGGDVTIMGQTAPGDGIAFAGNEFRFYGDNYIIRNIRIYPGDPSGTPDNWDVIKLYGDNAIFDHISIGWASDENFQIWTRDEGPVENVTIQWSVITEALNDPSFNTKGSHGYGLLLAPDSKNFSMHHNIFTYNVGRNPLVYGSGRTEFINNSADDYMDFSAQNHLYNIINNHTKRGIRLDSKSSGTNRAYVSGNYVIGGGKEWVVHSKGSVSSSFVTNSPTFTGSGIKTQSAIEANKLNSLYAGAIIPKKDSITNRAANRTGKIIKRMGEVGGWPSYAKGTYPKDSDNDGIPDAWENKNGLNPNNSADARQFSSRGYMWIEEYANSLIPMYGFDFDGDVTARGGDKNSNVDTGSSGLSCDGVTTLSLDFENGKIPEGTASEMKVPLKILTEDGNKFMRITGSASDKEMVPDSHPNRNRSQKFITKNSGAMPYLDDSNRKQFYSFDFRADANGYAAITEWFQQSDEHEEYATKNSKGPALRFFVSDGKLIFRSNYNAETEFKEFIIGDVDTSKWYHIDMQVVWSQDPDEAMVDVYLDGKEVVSIRNQPTNMGPASNRVPAWKLQLYGTYATGILDIDNAKIVNWGEGSCSAGSTNTDNNNSNGNGNSFTFKETNMGQGNTTDQPTAPPKDPELPTGESSRQCSFFGPSNASKLTLEGVGKPVNFFTNQTLSIAQCTDTTAFLSAGVTKSTYTWKTGYYWENNTWKPITFTGTEVGNTGWLYQEANATIPQNKNGIGIFISYSCIYNGTSFHCGCRSKDDAGCKITRSNTSGRWTLQVIKP